jgi:hypothetical protein
LADEDLSGGALAIDVEDEVRNGRPFGKWKDIGGFEESVCAVDKDLCDFGACGSIADLDLYAVVLESKCREPSIGGDQEPLCPGSSDPGKKEEHAKPASNQVGSTRVARPDSRRGSLLIWERGGGVI